MRINAHTAIPMGPVHSTPARQTASHSASPSTPTNAFAGILRTFGQTVGASSPAATVTALKSQQASATTSATTSATPPATVPASPTPAAVASTPVSPTASDAQVPGIQALVSAITSGSLQVSYITDPAKLLETTPAGTDHMPNFYYASDQTAAQIAQLLGGTVVQRPPFGQDTGWSEPLANFIQLPNGMTVNAADLAYYAKSARSGGAELTADITATINEGAALSNYFLNNAGNMPAFPEYYIGPPISGMIYPAGSIGADGNVINPATQV